MKTESLEHIPSIVLSGGPCSGKTKVLPDVKEHLENNGYFPIIVPEAATALIKAGLIPEKTISRSEFQDMVMNMQKENEMFYQGIAVKQQLLGKKVAIIYDRSDLDNIAYTPTKRKLELLDKIHDYTNKYDAVLHLNSTALIGIFKAENTDGITRVEPDISSMILADAMVLECNKHHPNLTIIPPEVSFEKRRENILKAIDQELGIIPLKHNYEQLMSKIAEQPLETEIEDELEK